MDVVQLTLMHFWIGANYGFSPLTFLNIYELVHSPIIDSDLKFHSYVNTAVSKANQILSLVNRSFVNLSTDMLATHTLVRPLLEYGNLIWGPFYILDQRLVENVQRRATRLIPGIVPEEMWGHAFAISDV